MCQRISQIEYRDRAHTCVHVHLHHCGSMLLRRNLLAGGAVAREVAHLPAGVAGAGRTAGSGSGALRPAPAGAASIAGGFTTVARWRVHFGGCERRCCGGQAARGRAAVDRREQLARRQYVAISTLC